LVLAGGEIRKEETETGTESPIGNIDKITNNGEISFTFQVAEWRGLHSRTFSRVLRELHRLGFIDVTQPGRGRKGEYTKYALSSRWRLYGTPSGRRFHFPMDSRKGSVPTNSKKISASAER